MSTTVFRSLWKLTREDSGSVAPRLIGFFSHEKQAKELAELDAQRVYAEFQAAGIPMLQAPIYSIVEVFEVTL